MDVTDREDLTLQRLNQEVLAAYGWPPFGGTVDIRTEWPDVVPARRGVYVFLDAGGEGITYPIGKSSVVYFGAEQQRRCGGGSATTGEGSRAVLASVTPGTLP